MTHHKFNMLSAMLLEPGRYAAPPAASRVCYTVRCSMGSGSLQKYSWGWDGSFIPVQAVMWPTLAVGTRPDPVDYAKSCTQDRYHGQFLPAITGVIQVSMGVSTSTSSRGRSRRAS